MRKAVENKKWTNLIKKDQVKTVKEPTDNEISLTGNTTIVEGNDLQISDETK